MERCVDSRTSDEERAVMFARADRFWSLVDKSGDCWRWTRRLFAGYGRFGINYRSFYAHRVAYELVKGPIPDGLAIDHRCRNKACVNPDHLDVVTIAENFKRSWPRGPESTSRPFKAVCKRGHELSAGNRCGGNGACRLCHNLRQREWTRKQKQVA
jgi:hypothetical protein